jgi:hypothetical protein
MAAKKPAPKGKTAAAKKAAAKKPAPTANKRAKPSNTTSSAKVSPTPKARVPKNPPKPIGGKMGSGSIPFQGMVPPQGAGPVGIGGV